MDTRVDCKNFLSLDFLKKGCLRSSVADGLKKTRKIIIRNLISKSKD
jgi:hypothetical protein